MAGRIVDHNGEPISLEMLQTEIATPQISGVRQVWQANVSGNLTPEDLVRILEHSTNHDPEQYLRLAEEMEEKDPHYFSVLGTRKLAVESVDIQVESATDDKEDVRLADATAEMLKLECAEDCRPDLLDALGKSFAVSEIKWDRSGREWMPARIDRVEPSWFLFDRETRQQLRLKDDADRTNGIPLAPYKFIQHRPRLKSGLPIRNGLARIIAFTWICSAYALKDWLAFAEVFGMPIRVGKYGPNASPTDVAMLRRAVANIGTDAACVIPETMKIEFEQIGNVSGAADLFERLCDYLDRQKSKAVLGQTMSTDAQASGMGSGNAEVHNEVRGDIRDADCGQLARTLRRDLVRPFVDLNFGPRPAEKYPKVIIRRKKPEDIKALSDALAIFVPQGLEVEQSEIRDKLGLSDPKPEAKLLRAPQKSEASPPVPPAESAKRATNALQGGVDLPAVQAQHLGAIADAKLLQLAEAVRELLEEVESLEEFRDRLLEAYPNLDAEGFADAMQMALTAAHLAGRYDVLEEAGGGAR